MTATRRPTRRTAPGPSFGAHENVTRYGRRLGSVHEVHGAWVPVCATCLRRLFAREQREDAKDALRTHWGARHSGGGK